MNFVKIIALQLLFLSSSTLLPAANALAVPLVAQQRVEQTRQYRLKACVVGSLCLLGAAGMATLSGYGLAASSSNHPTPQPPFPTFPPKPYHGERFMIVAKGGCSDKCHTTVGRQEMCIPDLVEWPAIQKRVEGICPNSTSVELSICVTSDYEPYPPCRDVNATLAELAATCSPHTATTVVPTAAAMDTVRARFRASQQQRAQLRKPAHLRS